MATRMKREYNLSGATRGKFYRPDTELNLPVYLEPDVAKAVRQRAAKKDVSVSVLVNDWLRKAVRTRTQRMG
jgi:hypothetical protein